LTAWVSPYDFPFQAHILCWLVQAAPCAVRFCSFEAPDFPCTECKHPTWHLVSQAFECSVLLHIAMGVENILLKPRADERYTPLRNRGHISVPATGLSSGFFPSTFCSVLFVSVSQRLRTDGNNYIFVAPLGTVNQTSCTSQPFKPHLLTLPET